MSTSFHLATNRIKALLTEEGLSAPLFSKDLALVDDLGLESLQVLEETNREESIRDFGDWIVSVID